MKNLLFILFLTPFISCCQIDNEYKLQNISPQDWDQYCINKTDCFYLNFDTVSFDYYILYFLHGSEKKQMIDTVFSQMLYGSTLNNFKFQKDNSYVVLWKIELENYPIFFVYYIKDGKITKIGQWIIYEPPGEVLPDYLDYPVEDIQIFQENNKIEFLFLKDVNFEVITDDYDDWGSFKANELIVSFNIIDGTVRRVEK